MTTTYIYTTIAPPGSISSTAEGINDLGQVVGQFKWRMLQKTLKIVAPPLPLLRWLVNVKRSGVAMKQTAVLDKIKILAFAIKFLGHFIYKNFHLFHGIPPDAPCV